MRFLMNSHNLQSVQPTEFDQQSGPVEVVHCQLSKYVSKYWHYFTVISQLQAAFCVTDTVIHTCTR